MSIRRIWLYPTCVRPDPSHYNFMTAIVLHVTDAGKPQAS